MWSCVCPYLMNHYHSYLISSYPNQDFSARVFLNCPQPASVFLAVRTCLFVLMVACTAHVHLQQSLIWLMGLVGVLLCNFMLEIVSGHMILRILLRRLFWKPRFWGKCRTLVKFWPSVYMSMAFALLEKGTMWKWIPECKHLKTSPSPSSCRWENVL